MAEQGCSHQKTLGSSPPPDPARRGRFGRLVITDKKVAFLGSLICLVLVVPLFLIGSMVMFLLPAILTVVLCISWMLMRKRNYLFDSHLGSRRASVVLAASFFVLLALSILTIGERPDTYERPLVFFVLSSMMAGTLALEISFSERRIVPLVLCQAIVLGILLSWSMLVLFPNVIGVDPWFHQLFTNSIITKGHVANGFGYSGIPLFHLLLGSSALLVGSDYKLVSMLVMIVGQLICEVLVVYLVATQVFNRHKVGLYASLVVVFASLSIHMSYEPTPTTLAFTFVLVVLLLMLRYDHKGLKGMSLIIFVLVVIVLTHSVTAICMATTLIIGYAIIKMRWLVPAHPRQFASATLIILFLVIMLGWWSYSPGIIPQLKELISYGFNRDYFGTGTLPLPTIPAVETILKWAGMMVYFSLAIIGVLHSISIKGNLRAIYVSVLGMTFLAVGIFALTAHLGLLEDRWWYYAQVILAIPLGATFYFIGNLLSKGSKSRSGRKQVLIALGIASLAIISILSPIANIDNSALFPNSGIRYAFTSSELQGASFTTSTTNGTISSDSDFITSSSSSVYINYIGVSPNRLSSLDVALMTHNITSDGSIQVIRTVIYDKPLRLEGQVYHLDYDLGQTLDASNVNKIYSNGGATAYI